MDATLLAYFNQTIVHPILDTAALLLSTVGLVFLPVLAICLIFSRHRRLGWAMLATLAATFGLILLFQYLGQRPRPIEVRLIYPTPNFPSYPSGHAGLAFATAVVLGLYARRLWLWLAALLFASFIALSRVYLGHHFPSDILAGAVFGASIGAACYGLFVTSTGLGAWARLQWLLWPQLAVAFLASHMAYLGILPWRLLDWPYSDKVFHFLLFGLSTFWLNLWLNGQTIQVKSWSVPLALIILLILGIIEEAGQAFSPRRTLSIVDFASNLLGLAVFWWASQQILGKNPPQRQRIGNPLNRKHHSTLS